MPPLVLFGRTWHVSSDDLMLPGIAGCVFHGTWCALIVAEVASVGLPDDCAQRALASSSILWLLLSFAVTTVLQIWVTTVSMRGAMLEEDKRASMPAALYCLLAAYAMEAAALVFLTAVTFGVLDAGRVQCYTNAELERTSWSEAAVMPWFIYSTWVALGIVGGLLVLLYNLYPDRGLDGWVNRINCLSYALCCWRSLKDGSDGSSGSTGGGSAPSQVLRLARVLGDLFTPLDFSFTDVVAALTLVGITHRSRAAGSGSTSHRHALIAAAEAGLLGDSGALMTLVGPTTATTAAADANGVSAQAAAGSSQAQPAQQVEWQQEGTAGAMMLAADEESDAAGAAPQAPAQQQPGWLPFFGAWRSRSGGSSAASEAPAAAPPAAAGSGAGDKPGLPHPSSTPPLLRRAVGGASSPGGTPGPSTAAQDSPAQGSHASGSLGGGRAGDAWPGNRPPGSSLGGCSASNGSSCAGLTDLAPGAAAGASAAGGGSHNSLWQLAIRQGSTLAVAPGHALKHAATAGVACGSRSLSSSTDPCGGGAGGTSSGSGSGSGSGTKLRSVSAAGAGRLPCAAGSMAAGPQTFSELLQPQQLLSGAGSGAGALEGAAAAGAPWPGTGSSSAAGGAALMGLTPAAAAAAAAVAGSMAAADGSAFEAAEDVAAAAASAVFGDGQAVPLELLEEALHWHRYALAIYGWPMFLWSHRYRVLRCCRLCCGRCFSCMQLGVSRSRHSSSGGTDAASSAAEDDAGQADPELSGAGVGGWGPGQQPGSCSACSSRGPGVPVAEGVEGARDAGSPGRARGSNSDLANSSSRVSLEKQQQQQKPAGGGGLSVGLASDDGCCFCCGGDWGSSHVPKLVPLTASQRLTREAIVQTANIPDSALLHVNYHNLVEGLLPYSVALDAPRRCVVLAIRGSLSVEDCVTDVLYDPAPLDKDWLLQLPASTAGDGSTAAAAAAKGADASLQQQRPAEPGEQQQLLGAASGGEAAAAACGSTGMRSSPFECAAAAAAASAAGPQSGSFAAAGDQWAAPVVPAAQAAAAAAAATAAAAGRSPVAAHQPAAAGFGQQQQPQLTATQSEALPAGGVAVATGCSSASPPPSRGLLSSFSLGFLPWRRSSSHHSDDEEQQQQHLAMQTHQRRHTTSSHALQHGPPLASGVSLDWPLPHAQHQQQQAPPAAAAAAGTSRASSRASLQRQLSQVQRTTAADRALGAARAGHRYAPVTSAATDAHAAAAAADARSHQAALHRRQNGEQQSAGASAPGSGAVSPRSSRHSQQQLLQPQGLGGSHSVCIPVFAAAPGGSAGPSSRAGSDGQLLRGTLSDRLLQEQGHSGAAAAAALDWGHGRCELTGGHLRDGGPTDRSLLSQAVPMAASRTAATHGPPHTPSSPAARSRRSTDEQRQLSPLAAQHQQQQQDSGFASGAPGSTAGDLEQGLAGHSQQQMQQLLADAEAAVLAAAAAQEAGTAEAAEADEAAAEADAAAAAAQAAAAEDTPDTGAAGTQWFAHEGILNCARAIRADLDRLGLLDHLLLGTTDDSSSSSSSSSSSEDPDAQDQQQPGSSGIGGGLGADGDTWSSPAVGRGSRQAGTASAAGSSSSAGARQWPDCRGWTLVLTGHSLGAGVAAILALHFRSRFPSVRVWSFAPPGGLMSPAAAASLKDICVSLVSGKDMIPRMSLWTVERLRDEMMLCALRCKMPKYKLLLGVLLGRDWEEGEVLQPLPLKPAAAERYRAYRTKVARERSMDPLRVRVAREFVPPGVVIWLQRSKVQQAPRRISLHRPAAAGVTTTPASAQPPALPTSRGVTTALERPAGIAIAGRRAAVANLVQPHFTDGLNLIVGGLAVSRNMFADHLPDMQLAQLKRLVRQLQRQQQAGPLRAPDVQEMASGRQQHKASGLGRAVRFAAA